MIETITLNFLLEVSGKSLKFWIRQKHKLRHPSTYSKRNGLEAKTCVIAKPWDLEHSWFPLLTCSCSCIPKGFHGVRWCVPLFIEQKLRQSRPMSMKAFPHLQHRTVANASLGWAIVWGHPLYYIVAKLLPRIFVWFYWPSIRVQTPDLYRRREKIMEIEYSCLSRCTILLDFNNSKK